MSVGGKIIQLHRVEPNRLWVNTIDKSQLCAIYCDPGGHELELGDKLWWQTGNAYWTSAKGAQTETLKKIGASGVSHPLGSEYEIKYDYTAILHQKKFWLDCFVRAVENILQGTPTREDGVFDEINETGLWGADQLLKIYRGDKQTKQRFMDGA